MCITAALNLFIIVSISFRKKRKVLVIFYYGSAIELYFVDGLLQLIVKISGSVINLVVNGAVDNLVRG